MQALNPPTLHPPFARYSHGLAAPAGRIVATSGQLGIRADGSVPAGARDQADLCFAALDAILAAAGLSARAVIRLNAYVTDRAHMPAYMAARDAWAATLDPPPASTLVIVGGFTRPEFLVEVEALAVAPA